MYQQQGDIEKGIRFLTEIIGKVPDNPDFIVYLASFYEDIEEYRKAEKTLLDGLNTLPDNTKLYFRLGVVYDKWGRKRDCIEIMKKVIELDSGDANALNYLGYTYADMGENLDEAERLIKAALKYKPDDGYIIDSLGLGLLQKRSL
ncbi:MAG: tetratricopeptide repeat protein [Desulfobacteraceae bacterium]|nr:tetratricopeptide repeat protein [Desulfobacteraceae bacterium]